MQPINIRAQSQPHVEDSMHFCASVFTALLKRDSILKLLAVPISIATLTVVLTLIVAALTTTIAALNISFYRSFDQPYACSSSAIAVSSAFAALISTAPVKSDRNVVSVFHGNENIVSAFVHSIAFIIFT